MFPEKLLDAIPSFLKISLQCGELLVVVLNSLNSCFSGKIYYLPLSTEVTLPAITLFFLIHF